MTAFARASLQQDWGTLVWEIRSVNHRYLETQFRLPDTLRDTEMALRELARKKLHRGKLDCTLQLTLHREQTGVHVNLEQARQYLEAASAVAGLMPDPAPISPLDILNWPGVLEERGIDSDQVKAATRDLFETALSQLTDHRAREGDRLGAFLRQRLDGIAAEVARVRAVLPDILATQKQRLRDRIAELCNTVDEERLEQEIVYIAQKADVDEELDRLDTHLAEIHRALDSEGAIGRRLDFLMQELNREANTLSSKSLATDTTQSAVELKVLIEQMREQIQNIE
jgi:uncharacterized protein (TIGR00255 family)